MTRKILAALLCLCAALPLLAPAARAQESDPAWTLVTADGEKVTSIAVEVSEGDEYIAGDNALYRVTSVDAQTRQAVLQRAGEEPAVAQALFGLTRTAKTQKVVGLYCTHSDESYEDGDGASSVESGWAGIHDVAATLKSWLEDKGVEVLFDTGSYLPHDAGAYRRSRSAAVELASQGPAALFDVHRDGIPDAAEYETEINGEPATMVRLLVGRSNPNSQENRQFAVQLKSVADEYYPGLVKDIFIGKGNYNQEILPDSVLLEFGTHVSDKEQVLTSTKYMADVIHIAVFGGEPGYSQKAQAENGAGNGTAAEDEGAAPAPSGAVTPVPGAPQSASTRTEERSGVWTALAWIVGLAVLGGLAFAVVSGGGFSGLSDRVKRFSSEVSGGLFGKKPKE